MVPRKTGVFRRCNSNFSRKHVDVLETEGSVQLNGTFLATGLGLIMEEKYYRALDILFPFICVSAHHVTGY